MLRPIILSAAILIGGCQAEAEVPATWTLEREYHTDCLSPMDGGRVFDGVTYTTKGWREDNHFMALDLVTGECTRAGDLSSGSSFGPRAANEQYLFANAGQYYMRYTLFDRANGQRVGSVALRERVWQAVFHGNRLYALQDEQGDPVLAVFTLPDLRFVEQHSVAAPYMRSADALDDGFLINWTLDERTHVGVIDFAGRVVRETALPAVEHAASNHCPSSARRLGDDAVLVRTGCDGYAVLDLASLAVRYRLPVTEDVGYLADVFVADGLIYMMDGHDIDRDRAPVFMTTLFDLATGERIGELPPLTAERYPYHQQVGHRLIFASRAYMEGADVRVFDLRRRPGG